ncbi:hypothetical protein BU26DRAFT_525138 [Trematosphaeria pertusa]|uniref:Uncharacterized protein n=1 Tax=Trematosphaeria pertusa TaxID=390896 RepID=A0A6A6HU56_9PLEO|nr:uncharacterized protein BU26DRAFT_525138 [Trematosphaeria pertusa]KAF2241636.1 hypothetical protein BU26DRAFT_525138 [Trematosphaeria pertusa]
MVSAWTALFRRAFNFLRTKGRPSSPELTSLEHPERYLPPSPSKRLPFSAFSADTPNTEASSISMQTTGPITEMQTLSQRPGFERVKSEIGLLQAPGPQRVQSFFENNSSASSSRVEMPTIPIHPPSTPESLANDLSPPRRYSESQIQPPDMSRSYTPMRDAPTPPPRSLSAASRVPPSPILTTSTVKRSSTLSGLSIQKTNSSKLRGRISTPIPGTFVHVNGAWMDGRKREGGPLGLNPISPVEREDCNMERDEQA